MPVVKVSESAMTRLIVKAKLLGVSVKDYLESLVNVDFEADEEEDEGVDTDEAEEDEADEEEEEEEEEADEADEDE